MANNILFIPFINDVKFVELSPTEIPAYLTKHFDDYKFAAQIADTPWIEQVAYIQKWQTSDIIKLQIESNYAPINIILITADDTVITTVTAQNIRANKYEAGLYVYEAEISLAGIDPGCYYLKLEAGSPVLKTLVSEPLNILVKHDNSVFLEYSNSRYHADVIFETGIVLGMRVEGVLTGYTPGGKRNIYEDEKLNPTVLSAKPFRTFTLSVGAVPDWIIDKLMWIWSCNNVLVDGKSFAMTDETFEIKELDTLYPLRSVNIKLREGINRGSKIIKATGNQNLKLVVGLNISSSLFGDTSGNGNSNTIKIFDVE